MPSYELAACKTLATSKRRECTASPYATRSKGVGGGTVYRIASPAARAVPQLPRAPSSDPAAHLACGTRLTATDARRAIALIDPCAPPR